MRILIFVAYIIFCAHMPYIKRVFQYHGAEHKTIFCYESQEELTVENVRRHIRFHPRCGTSFMVIMLLLGILIGFFIPFTNPFLRTTVKLLCIPLVVGVGYELIKICGRGQKAKSKQVQRHVRTNQQPFSGCLRTFSRSSVFPHRPRPFPYVCPHKLHCQSPSIFSPFGKAYEEGLSNMLRASKFIL